MELKDIELHCGDCLEMMDKIPDCSIDMVLTDPPYSSGGTFAGDRKADTRTKYTSNKYNGAARFENFSGDNMDQRSYTEFLRLVFSKARKKVKSGGILATFIDWRNLPAMTDAVQNAGWIWRGILVWDKGSARNIPGRYRQDCEFIVWATNGPREVDWTPGFTAAPGCYHIPGVPTKKKHHQTEKPVELIESLLRIAPEGGEILDPFMGSGTTGVACVKTGRKFTGIELGQGYFETSQKRIREEITCGKE